VEDFIRNAVEETTKKRRKLIVVLETSGGYVEVVQRIADTLRHHYRKVEFVIPDHAMSAGSVLVMCGDAIHMDYYSVLGPIDPQVERPDGKMIPALGYLVKYKELIDKSAAGNLTTAEMTFLVSKLILRNFTRMNWPRTCPILCSRSGLLNISLRIGRSRKPTNVR
jgi:ClpP class serine protease